jgi:hypothetical protein
MKPSIKTSPFAASCTTAGTSPDILSKSISWSIPVLHRFCTNKKPAERFSRQRALYLSALSSSARHPRQRADVRVMVMMAMN